MRHIITFMIHNFSFFICLYFIKFIYPKNSYSVLFNFQEKCCCLLKEKKQVTPYQTKCTPSAQSPKHGNHDHQNPIRLKQAHTGNDAVGVLQALKLRASGGSRWSKNQWAGCSANIYHSAINFFYNLRYLGFMSLNRQRKNMVKTIQWLVKNN